MSTNTFDDIDRLFDRMHRFAGFGDDGRWSDWDGRRGHSSVSVDVSEHDGEFVVVADLPGFDDEEIDLSVEDDRLVITASHAAAAGEGGEQYLRRERAHQPVRRSLALPAEVDPEGASATYTNGVLTVALPMAGERDGYHIDIN